MFTQQRSASGASCSHASNIHRTSCWSGLPRGFGCLNLRPSSHLNILFRLNTFSHYTKVWNRTWPISDAPLSRSTRRSFAQAAGTEIAPKSPFLCVNRSAIRHEFWIRAGAKAMWYNLNIAPCYFNTGTIWKNFLRTYSVFSCFSVTRTGRNCLTSWIKLYKAFHEEFDRQVSFADDGKLS